MTAECCRDLVLREPTAGEAAHLAGPREAVPSRPAEDIQIREESSFAMSLHGSLLTELNIILFDKEKDLKNLAPF